jgi:hypothetical protein
MATPHVAGVVALVRAAAPSLGALQVVDAVLAGTSAMPGVTAGKRTVTEGIADACKAIALATNGDIPAECPASSDPVHQPPEVGGTVPPPIPVAPDAETPTGARRSDRARPQTFFKKRPGGTIRTSGHRVRAVFEFGSNESGVDFLCRFDGGAFRICPPRTARRFALGRHVLRVKARDAAGNTDRTPAVCRFRVVRLD